MLNLLLIKKIIKVIFFVIIVLIEKGSRSNRMFKFIKSNSFKINLLDSQLEQLSTMEKISKVINDENIIAFDVYKGNILIGFIMLKEYDDGYFLWDYAVDYRYQGLGYGQAILEELIIMLKSKSNAKWISTTYKYGNDIAKHIYEKVGFIETSIINENGIHEVNMYFNIN